MFLFSYFTRLQERDSFLPSFPLPSLSPLLFSFDTQGIRLRTPVYWAIAVYWGTSRPILIPTRWMVFDDKDETLLNEISALKKKVPENSLTPPVIGRWSKKLSSGTINRLIVDMVSSGLPVSKMVRNNFWLSTNKPFSGWYYYGNLTGLSFVLLCNSWMKARHIIWGSGLKPTRSED